jgi:hypothetical protein
MRESDPGQLVRRGRAPSGSLASPVSRPVDRPAVECAAADPTVGFLQRRTARRCPQLLNLLSGYREGKSLGRHVAIPDDRHQSPVERVGCGYSDRACELRVQDRRLPVLSRLSDCLTTEVTRCCQDSPTSRCAAPSSSLRCWPAAGRQGLGDPGPPPPAHRPSPTSPASQAGACGSGPARRHQPCASEITLVLLVREAETLLRWHRRLVAVPGPTRIASRAGHRLPGRWSS